VKRLLIVDDDRDLLMSLEAVFQGRYKTSLAESAEAAFALLKERPVDVILLDVILPGEDGVSFLRKLRLHDRHMPVVMISAGISILPILDSLGLGAFDYIRKPFDVEDLRHVLRRALETAELARRVAELEKQLSPDEKTLKEAVEEYERAMIERVLERNGGVQTHTAEELGTTRRILRYRIDKLGIKPPKG